jgi:hypothetical protein
VRHKIERHRVDQAHKHRHIAAAQSSQNKRRPRGVNDLRVAGHERHHRFGAGDIADDLHLEMIFLKQTEFLSDEQNHMTGGETAKADAEFVLSVRNPERPRGGNHQTNQNPSSTNHSVPFSKSPTL